MAVCRHQSGILEAVGRSQFYNDVITGLSSSPRFLQSKYFYDARGDKLFQEIMRLSEYYLTRCEMEIFSTQTKTLAVPILENFEQFDVLELGAGDAVKSTHLLRYLHQSGRPFTYYPIDISKHIIEYLEEKMPSQIPGLQMQGLQGDYFEMINKSYRISSRRKLVLFLGSTIGNFIPENAERLLSELNAQLQPGDLMIIGFDLKKSPYTILAAYNDSRGITKAFNLNLLCRINRELDGNFDVSKFGHFPTYDPATGACKSYLISTENQQVPIGKELFSFYKDEPIWTELSQKYSEQEINELAVLTGFIPVQNFYDGRHWFVDALWKKR